LAAALTAFVLAATVRATHEDKRNFIGYLEATIDSCRRWGFDDTWAVACFMWESGYDPEAVSGAGAMNVPQIMPRTASIYAPGITVEGLRNPEVAIDLAVRHLAVLDKKHGGDKLEVMQEYFWGGVDRPHVYYYWNVAQTRKALKQGKTKKGRR
jgi:soluble lytic murein transglycosylase-like protein